MSRQLSADPSFDGTYPLTGPQAAVWLEDQFAAGPNFFIYAEWVRIVGPLDPAAFKDALQYVVDRTQALRIQLSRRGDLPRQHVADQVSCDLEVVDLRPSVSAESAARQWMDAHVERPFDLEAGRLFHYALIRISDECSLWYSKYHHIIMDGAALATVAGRVAAAYTAIRNGAEPHWTADQDWADIVQDDVAYSSSQQKQKDRAFWLAHCRDLPQPVTLSQRHAPDREPGRIGHSGGPLPAPLSQLHRKLVRSVAAKPVTCLHVLYAIVHCYLTRISGRQDITIGLPWANRPAGSARMTPGMFATVTVPRIRFDHEATFGELLTAVARTLAECAPYCRYPLQELVRQPGVFDARATRPYNVALSYMPFAYSFEFDDCVVVENEFLSPPCADLLLFFRDDRRAGVGRLDIHYADNLYTPTEIDLHRKRLLALLESAPDYIDTPLNQIPLMPPDELQQVLVQWNDTAAEYPHDRCVHELFEQQAQKTPNAVAVAFGDEQLTYTQLNERANRLAHHLTDKGVAAGQMVGVSLDRSTRMIVTLLAILKAGGAYLPLDPTYPHDRIAFMLDDAGLRILVTDQRYAQRFNSSQTTAIDLDRDAPCIAQRSTADPATDTQPLDLAYAIYTSGSTGTPKAVTIPHRAVTRLVCNTDYIHLEPTDRIAQVSNASFDAVIFEIWGALLNGATLVIIEHETSFSPRRLAGRLTDDRITTIFLTTSIFNEMVRDVPEALGSLRYVMFGGEVARPEWVQRLLELTPPVHLINMYGPTESTTFTTWHEINRVEQAATSIPIGRPIANTRVYVLDQHRQPVPVGVPSELYIGGDGLARGYLNRPQLTDERFVADPFSRDEIARLYKTGDRCRWRPDGDLEFLGRDDHQVKIRGMRIELNEIESVILQEPAVQQCVATVNAPSDEPDDRRITAYLSAQAGSEVSMAQLRQQLTSRLPEYMLPSYYVQVETWPLTPNGKIDREALPPPNTADAHQADAYVAPRTEVEKRMAMIWQDLLRTDRIGIHDNFFERGGHSLLAVRLINEVEDQFAMRLSLKTVFNAPTVLQLARAMGHDQGPCTIVPLHPGPSADAKPPLFCIWGIFIYQELARQLDADRPVYAIHVETELQTLAVGNGHQRTGTPSIPAMAEQYLEQIKTIQPTGPYYLAGSSVGGLLALEIAQQLRRAGQSTAMLALFDTFLPGAIRWRCLHWLRHHLVELVQTGPAAFLQRCRQRRAGRRNHERVVQHMDQKRQHAMRKAMQRYRIQPYPGRILLFRATDLDLRPGTVIRPDHGWHRVHPKELEAHDVPTGHIEMLKAPHVQLLADQMRKSM